MDKTLLKKNREKIKSYIRRGEVEKGQGKIGLEVEHFIVNKNDQTSITYYEENGIENLLLRVLEKEKCSGIYEEGRILGLNVNGSTITLEPGAQVEISVKPFNKISSIRDEYVHILGLIKKHLTEDQDIIEAGYHPRSKIEDIPFIPKKRYAYMSDYFRERGKHAINMMKGTASTQVSIDYYNEGDFTKKFRVANFLSPVIYALMDNSPVFEGEMWRKHALRIHIWRNCDSDRCGIVPFDNNREINYENYTEYIMNNIPIIIKKKGEYLYTKKMKVNDFLREHPVMEDEIEHLLSMFFPDVRAKKYIEIRMADSVPVDMSMAYCTFIKGIFYNDNLLNELNEFSKDLTSSDIEKYKNELMSYGLETKIKNISIRELAQGLLKKSEIILGDEKKYLYPLYKKLNNRRD